MRQQARIVRWISLSFVAVSFGTLMLSAPRRAQGQTSTGSGSSTGTDSNTATNTNTAPNVDTGGGCC